MKDQDIDKFVQNWHAKVTETTERRMRVGELVNPFRDYNVFDNPYTVTTYQEPVMRIELPQKQFDQLISMANQQEWHEEAQRRYPHLREAYINYLSQVYLTVDPQEFS